MGMSPRVILVLLLTVCRCPGTWGGNARCTVEAGGRKQTGEVMSGGSYYSQDSMTLHFGLGNAEKIDRIEVRWPSGLQQSWTDVAANRTLVITEGNETFQASRWARP